VRFGIFENWGLQMTCIHKPYDTSSPTDRRYAMAEAIAAQRLAGLEIDPDTISDFEKFCAGQIDLLQLRANSRGSVGPLE
jgi:hypothetical protein